MSTPPRSAVFDYRALRLLLGLIAFSLPFVVGLLANERLPSISASYHTDARDAFVGMLFVVAALLWAYNGHTPLQALLSKAAAVATILVVVFPTSCAECSADLKSGLHYGSAAVLFAILAFFCFGPFREKTKGRPGKKGRRGRIYLVCGWVIVLSMFAMLVAKLTLSTVTTTDLRITYWAETVALIAFGIAWIVAGKYLSVLVDRDEQLQLFN